MWAEQCRSSRAHSCSGFLWCAIYSIPSLIPSRHSLLRKPLYTEFRMCLNDHSQFMQHFVNTELLLSRELKCYLCCSSQACSSSQHLLVTLLCRYIAVFLNCIWLSCQNVLLICFLIQQTSISHLSCNSVPADVCSIFIPANFCWYNTRYFKVTLWTWIGLQASYTHVNFAY